MDVPGSYYEFAVRIFVTKSVITQYDVEELAQKMEETISKALRVDMTLNQFDYRVEVKGPLQEDS
jgi:hypothetical protein